jgi:hypothetical protein
MSAAPDSSAQNFQNESMARPHESAYATALFHRWIASRQLHATGRQHIRSPPVVTFEVQVRNVASGAPQLGTGPLRGVLGIGGDARL